MKVDFSVLLSAKQLGVHEACQPTWGRLIATCVQFSAESSTGSEACVAHHSSDTPEGMLQAYRFPRCGQLTPLSLSHHRREMHTFEKCVPCRNIHPACGLSPADPSLITATHFGYITKQNKKLLRILKSQQKQTGGIDELTLGKAPQVCFLVWSVPSLGALHQGAQHV